MTGMSEKALARLGKRRGVDYGVVYAHPNSHASYYPGATPVSIKLIYEVLSGRVLGAQAVGRQGIDKRIDVIALAIQMRATVFDLAQAEMCYAPPFGSAKDPVNMIGFLAGNALRGLSHPVQADELKDMLADSSVTVVDVRTTDEFEMGAIPAAIHVPLEELRARVAEIPRGGTVVTYCKVGQRGYLAERILKQRGFEDVRNLSGGFTTWQQYHGSPPQ
jgi:rhodanese-related sulfurtransferase